MDALRVPTGDKWQSKTLVVAISDPRSSMNSVSIAVYPVWKQNYFFNCKLFLEALVLDCFVYYFSIFNKYIR